MPKWILEDQEYSPTDRDTLPEKYKHFGDFDGRFYKGPTDGVDKPPIEWTDDIEQAHTWATKGDALFFAESHFGVNDVGDTGPIFPIRKDRVK